MRGMTALYGKAELVVYLLIILAGDLPLQEAMHCSDRIRPVHLLTAQRKGLINAPDIDN